MGIRPPFTPEQHADLDAREQADVWRPAYIYPGPRSEYKISEPWHELDQAAVDAWRKEDMANRWSTSDKTAKALAWLELTFGGYSDPEGA